VIKKNKYKIAANIMGMVAVLSFCYYMHLKSNENIRDNSALAIGITTTELIHKGHTRRIYYEFVHNQKKYKNYYSENILSQSADLSVPGGLYLVVYDSLQPKNSRLDINNYFRSRIEGDSLIENNLIRNITIE